MKAFSRSILAWAPLVAAVLFAADAVAGTGNAHVSHAGGRVRVTGDAGNNDVSVTQSGNTITITGRNGTTLSAGPGATVDPNNPNVITVTGVGTNTRVKVDVSGGDNKVDVKDLKVNRVEVKARGGGDNTITVDDSRTGDKLEVETGSGDDSITVSDSAWGRREVDPGGGTNKVTGIPTGKGGAGQVGTPPPAPTPTPPNPNPGGGSSSKAPLNAQDAGLPTANPGQRGLIPDVPDVPQQPTYSPGSKNYGPKGGGSKKYP